jgi:thymidylate synthase
MGVSSELLAEAVVEEPTLGLAWLAALRLILQDGRWTHDGPDHLLELRPLIMRIASADEDDPIIRLCADHERIDLMLLKYRSCNILPGYRVSYGGLLYDNDGVDQIAWVVDRLRSKPETKSATITMHRPGEAYLSCLSLLDFKLREHELDMTAIYRSQNVFASQPGNVLALREIQREVASRLALPAGVFDLVALSAHVYERDLERATQLCRSQQPSIQAPKVQRPRLGARRG